MIGVGIMRMVFGSGGRAAEALVNTFATSDSLYVVGDTISFLKPSNTSAIAAANGIYVFPVRNGKQFKISLYGGGGGYHNNTYTWGANPNGGILVATIDLTAYQGTDLYIVRGGAGQNDSSSIDGYTGSGQLGGFNGGGRGAGSSGPSGAGRTDLRTGNPGTNPATNYATELLVAGGGGGGYGTNTALNIRYYGGNGQTGTEGDYPRDNAGGGAGYTGGKGSTGDDTRNGTTGTNYYDAVKTITVHQNLRCLNLTSGGNSGHGYFTIEVISIQ